MCVCVCVCVVSVTVKCKMSFVVASFGSDDNNYG